MEKQLIGVEQNVHQIKLRQMGADITAIQGVLHYVRFMIKDTKFEYVYHINKKGEYFLQRKAPYPLNVGTYSKEDDVIDIINIDVNKMKNATKSKKFQRFIGDNQTISTILQNFEDLYLHYNVSRGDIEEIDKKILELKDLISKTRDKSEKVYVK